MKTRQLFFSLPFLLFTIAFQAQKMDLGKVTIAELEEKEHPRDPAAPAAILFKIGESRTRDENGYISVTEVKTKIKIYKKEGFQWANQEVAFYKLGNTENIYFSDAVTYNLVDGKIVKSKLKSDGQFEEKINKFFSRKKITLPNVKEGSIIEYSYIIKSIGYSIPRRWDFQTTIPMNYCQYKTYIPQYFVYKKSQKGYLFPKVTDEKINNNLGFYDNVTTYVAENFPAIKKEAYVNNINNYVSSVSHELATIDIPRVLLKSISTNWDNITNEIYKMDDFGLELNKKGYFEDELAPILKGLEKRDDKIAAILNFVKSKVKWNGYESYLCDDGVKAAYKNQLGNAAEINLMLVAMLRSAGIDANPVLLSTQSNGVVLFPSRTAFNYVIAAVEITEDLILLDATEQFSEPNILPLRDLNWTGRLIRKEGSSTDIDLFPKTLAKEAVNMSVSINPDATANGKIRCQLACHEALVYRQNNKSVNDEVYLETLENKYKAIEVDDYKRENLLDNTKPIMETYSFKDSNSAELIDGKIYFSPLLFLGLKENPFKQETREYPIDFNYPFQKKYNINVTLPEGYAVESLPQPVNMITGDDIGDFKYMIVANQNQIQVSVLMDIYKPLVASDFYEVVKDFYQKVVDKENEKVVLVKQ
ncbi:DUF3857 and transglutaminase domain-containing protein [Flavobacterium sp. CYK-4]|uniref:DUF3857 domain-containing protein n=1 Tax=Flavobacterium lotistagni TaxID=2709660 RepID=UPI00140A92C0|nr:DUF3857 domain-containing protein [Flavobacterium lotistagni]NHM08103.1 DUF3857 and transglutaminase domain-containing protein [Flavobacterium lotistagni]